MKKLWTKEIGQNTVVRKLTLLKRNDIIDGNLNENEMFSKTSLDWQLNQFRASYIYITEILFPKVKM